jgi:hypothetical protein
MDINLRASDRLLWLWCGLSPKGSCVGNLVLIVVMEEVVGLLKDEAQCDTMPLEWMKVFLMGPWVCPWEQVVLSVHQIPDLCFGFLFVISCFCTHSCHHVLCDSIFDDSFNWAVITPMTCPLETPKLWAK